MYIYIHRHLYIYYAYRYRCVYLNTYIYIHIYIDVYKCIHIQIFIHIYVYTYIYINLYVYTYVYIHILYIYIHCNALQRTATHCNTLLSRDDCSHINPRLKMACRIHEGDMSRTWCRYSWSSWPIIIILIKETPPGGGVFWQSTRHDACVSSRYVARVYIWCVSMWHACIYDACLYLEDTLQHTAPHCNTLQHTETHCCASSRSCHTIRTVCIFKGLRALYAYLTVCILHICIYLHIILVYTHCNEANAPYMMCVCSESLECAHQLHLTRVKKKDVWYFVYMHLNLVYTHVELVYTPLKLVYRHLKLVCTHLKAS